jgi:thiol-disulfide isomerase/thioredoxin
MKKIFVPLLILLAGIVVSTAQTKTERPENYRDVGALLPPMRVIDTFGTEHREDEFKNGHPFFMVLFNPTCGHCIDMGRLIGSNIEAFDSCKVLFLAGVQMMPYLNTYYQATGLVNHPQIVVGIDSAQTVDRLFNYKPLPQINIYDEESKLVKIFYGGVAIDSLRQYVR